MRRSYVSLIGLLFSLGLLISTPAFAIDQKANINQMLQETAGPQGAGYDISGNANTGLATLVGRIVNIFLSLLGVIFVILVVYGGFLWMTAAGDEEKVEKAKKIISQGVIGLAVILSAWAIYMFIINILGSVSGSGSGGTDSGIIVG